MQSLANHISIPSPVEQIVTRQTKAAKVKLLIKRDDLIHPQISGNKWRKLKFNLEECHKLGRDTLVTFGGAFSNHLLAVAQAAYILTWQSVGFVRTYMLDKRNPTICLLSKLGMRVIPVLPAEYERLKVDPDLIAKHINLSKSYIIPEGGTNEYAIRGVGELWSEMNQNVDTFITSVGTGGTLAGLVQNKPLECKLIGMTLFKENITSIEGLNFIEKSESYQFIKCNDGLRFGKFNIDLVNFINQFSKTHDILLDPIYTARAMRRLLELIEQGYFETGSTICFHHSGGLQGVMGHNYMSKHPINVIDKPQYSWILR